MNRSFGKWLLSVAILAGIAGSSAPACAQDTAEIDLAEITRRLEAWRASFVNLRVVWELRELSTTATQPLPAWSPPADPEDARLFLRKEWIWADDGMDLLESSGVGAERRRTVEVFNGRKGVVFRAAYARPKQGPEELKLLSIRGLGVGKPISVKSRQPMEGVYWNASARWLPELLSEWEWTWEGIEEIGGERCARIVPAPGTPGLGSSRPVIWVDLNHDCLVRRYLTPRTDDPERAWTDFIVDEFQRLPNGIWFPKRGRLQLQPEPLNQLWVVTEVAVNEPLDLRRFQPPAPTKGTLMDEGGRSYVYGAPRARPQNGGEPTSNADTIPGDRHARSATPPPPAWRWWSGALLILSFLFLAAGFWFWRRR